LLDAIHANLVAVRKHTSRLVLAPVKANAYGHGAVAVSKMIERTKAADWLGVATVGEGVELRNAGITLPILKLSVARGPEVLAALEHQITLPITDGQAVREISGAAKLLGAVANVHLKVDTGMRRIGCPPEAAPLLAKSAVQNENLMLTGIFSHMPVSDTPSQDEFSQRQIRVFADACAATEAVAGTLTKHLANSGAVLAHPDAWFDLVRPGIMIYGAYPDPATARSVAIEPALRWTSKLSFVKRVSAGETVGYGRTWTAKTDTYIGTVPVGYGDGYSRLLSNRGRVLIGGKSYPIAGRICMDQFMVDLGPQTNAAVLDEVVLIGADGNERITVDEIAGLMGTIPYEVTCLIQTRVGRKS
jgi:alanine racemase